ncbi:protein-L-isoaspartate O-methyltransferase [Roseomonas stagni]|uniref:Protein-L-isoaspartate O-methyltransferase n=1 Tax=Falsiroseomonas algicola TaxID=2716930 RepID=A0A6M1LNM1_9PROT|nr:protein-L-isoaspartate O-methyltransferase [Falsiroseomonas algicola]NGM21981.1 protein-L-isoaspartate O-methyltransferase [Falsiroseomonas algicola]
MELGTALDTTEARRRMVDGQLRPNKVTDPRVIAAMLDLPRERFLPAAAAARAYGDGIIPLPGGRAMLTPMVTARLVQLLGLRDGDRVLVVGAGTGYVAAVAAHCGARVTALEEDAGLQGIAAKALAGLFPPGAITAVSGSLPEGHAAGAPYDAILIEGEVPAIPAALSAQLAEGGRLAAILAARGPAAGPRAVLGRKAGGSFGTTDAFDCATVPLPAFQPAPGFVF